MTWFSASLVPAGIRTSSLREVPGVSGSTILDTGRVALILDVSTLLREVIAEQAQAVN